MDINLMIATVQAYIAHRKNITVFINLEQFKEHQNLVKLVDAYEYAIAFFENNNGTIQIL